MTLRDGFQLVLYGGLLLALVKPLGKYMARVYEGKPVFLSRVLGPLERFCYRLSGVDPAKEVGWKSYAVSLMVFSAAGLAVVYALQRLQSLLPLNPAGLGPVSPDSSFNTAVSFVTNTNWQGYGGESTMSDLTQMAGLGVQNFVSAASGMAVLAALIRGLARRCSDTVGNFWVDLTRSTLYILLPLSFVLALALVAEGVPQTFRAYETVDLLQPTSYDEHENGVVRPVKVLTQTLPLGPVASQVAIKQLGTNGGGYFNANSCHPYENPTPLSNFLQCLAILLIPAALCNTFGEMVGDRRQGWALLSAMILIFVPMLWLTTAQELQPNPALAGLGTDSGGNLEGKELRFGIVNSALWACATTAASNGSVNSMHASFEPLGAFGPLWLIQLGEVVFGGVGSGLYGLVVFAIVAVFVSGLMVGRTPEYLGKKIEPYEMKMSSLVVLIPPLLVLAGTALAVAVEPGRSSVLNPGPRGFTEILYAFSSAGNNNGSAFAGLNANTPFYNFSLGIVMFFARFWLAVPTLAIAGSLGRKKIVPPGPGTLPTHTPLFVGLLASVVLVVGALTFIPALALGPIVEHLMR